ncbi:MAG: tripartite tricarboxylate transporter substrate binding protein [Burkholderiales bacterium]
MSTHARTVLAVGLALAAGAAAAADYPSRPLRMVVPFAPGGGSDIVGRIIGIKLTEAWGQQVVVDNRAGGNANIGALVVAKAPADGYTLLLGNANFTINPALIRDMPFDPVKDFAPVTLLANVTNMLAVHASLPVRSVKELIAYAKARPGQLNFASPGAGTSSHLGGELFRSMAGIEVVAIHYKGATPAMTDLIGGQVSFTITSMLSVMPHVKSGRLRALGVTTLKRSPAMPDLPTIAESGLPGFEATNWYGVLTTAGTPKPVVDRLNRELVRIVASPDVREKFSQQGAEPETNTPAEYERFIKAEITKWAKVVREAGIKPE